MSQRVLVVDDSLTVRMDLAEAFEAAGLAATTCDSLAAARALLRANDIGLVVLDVMLPDGDGVDLLRELRAGGRASLPVVMLSTEAEVQDRIRGLATGADDYVGKPYDAPYLVARARELLGRTEPSDDQRPAVLVVDDSWTYREHLAEMLEAAGYRAILADSGRSGFAVLADRRPAAIIVDGVMPDMDGATLIRRVRLDAALRDLPCIMLTASEDPGTQLRALDAGADTFVRKDEVADVIIARLAAVMRGRSESRLPQLSSLAAPRRILAVDDSPADLVSLADTLRAEGYDVSLARSGEEAIDLLAVECPDCILMKRSMPGIGGEEACRRIKAASGLRDVPLILFADADDPVALLDALAGGADDYVTKSSGIEVLAARVRAQIRRKQLEDESRRYREELLGSELAASEERAARMLAQERAAMVDELERTVETRTRELEQSLVERRHAERLASVGMMAASIAHEINNPLAIVIANLELVSLALDSLRDCDATVAPSSGGESLASQLLDRLGTAADPLRDALEAAERVRTIVRDLRIFARSDGDSVTEAVDLHKVLESVFRMASNEVRHRAVLIRDFGDIPLVRGNESRLGQVFLNLVVNAAQAMPPGRATANEIDVSTRLEEGAVVVRVADTGVGIEASSLGRVFEPFFTTKPAGVGTGLGLAICKRIVMELGGAITVDSTLGVGTVFTVTLRSATAAVSAPPPPTEHRQRGTSRRGRVLVVDDEVSLCRTIGRVLSPDHDVTTVTSAREALAVISASPAFDVILSDVMMPDMTGIELHDTLSQTAPDQAARMVFMSGGAFSEEAARFLAQRPGRVIDKPFRPAALRAAVDTALERADAA